MSENTTGPWQGVALLKINFLHSRRFVFVAVTAFLIISLATCGRHHFSWKEEVLLQSGELIKVERSAKAEDLGEIGGPGGWESKGMTLKIVEPRRESNPPEWSGAYVPILFDQDPKNKEWFLVATFYTCQGWYDLGKPALPYTEYRLKNGKWIQGPLSPELIGRAVNLLTTIRSKGEPDHTLESKRVIDSDVRIEPRFKSIVGHYSTGC